MTIRDCRTQPVADIAPGGDASIIARGTLAEFRACHGRITRGDGGVTLDPAAAALLDVTAGQDVCHAPR
jgi:arginine N-succinyltransferase